MKNILVTGGCGFIGSNFIRYLFEKTDFVGRVVNVDKLTYAGNPDNLTDIADKYFTRYFFEKTDICDVRCLPVIFDKFDIDSVVHFAAESHVDRSISGPEEFINTNIMGTFNLLETIRLYKKPFTRLHHVSTDEVYGSLGDEGLFTEKTPYDPHNPYSATKASADHLVRAYNHTYGIPVTISNCSNNYGPYQFPEKLIPLIILNASEYRELPVYGDGKNIRDWLYVDDHCNAIWSILNNGKNGETYNVGGNTEMTNIAIVETICDMFDEIDEIGPYTNSRRNCIKFVKDRPGHDMRYAIDSSKLQKELQWVPAESFSSGIYKTIMWYLNNDLWVERVKNNEYMSWITKQYCE